MRRYRPHMPEAVKKSVLRMQGGLCACGCKTVLSDDRQDIRFDHRPALWQRDYCEVTRRYKPDANDVCFIRAVTVWCDRPKTYGTKATTRGSDLGERARSNRIRKSHEAFLAHLASRECGQKRQLSGKIPSRKFAQNGRARFARRKMRAEKINDE